MTTVNKKIIRISSPGSDSEDKVQENAKSHEKCQNGDACGEKRLKSKTCYVCDGIDNWVLVCHGEECLISMHQSCTSEEPDFDELGNFYCPYCWYKRVVVKSLKLREKLLVIDKSRKSRETLGGVGMGLMMDQVSEDVENVVEVNVSVGRRVTIVNPSGDNRERDDESYEKFMAMEKEQRMREVQSREALEAGDDDDEGRQKGERFSEKNEERKKQRRCDINNKTVPLQSFVACVNTRSQRRCSEKSQQSERRTQEKGVFINGEVAESDLGEGTSGQGCCHENNKQQKASSTQSCEQKGRMTDKGLSHGKHISEDGKRKRKGAVVRDGDEFGLASDMRNDVATFNEQENGFSKDEQIEHNCASFISSPISTDNVNESNVASQKLALIIHPGVQERPIEAQPFRSVPPDKSYGHKSYLEKNGTASHDPRKSDRKRKRQFWTQAEEEMLRVGVQKFPGVRNIPWRKILEFGRDVFHEERVPSDLKDKWKKLKEMLSFEAGKWVSLSTERQPNHLLSE